MPASLSSFMAELLSSEELADATSERILDAALDEFRRTGVRGTSLDAVAKRAQIGRVTIYRRFGNKQGLLRALILRECGIIIAEVEAANTRGSPDDVEDRFALGFVAMLRATHGRSLFKSWLKHEPADLLRHLTFGGETMMRVGIAFIARHIRVAQRSGQLPAYDPNPVAEILARFAHSLMLTPKGGIALSDERQAYEFARSFIVPIVTREAEGQRAPIPRRRKSRGVN